MDQLFSEGAGADAFGTFQPEAVAVARRLVGQMREIGGSIAVSPGAAAEFEHRVIDPWLAEHPLNERRIVLDEVSRERALVMEAISGELQQAIGAMVRALTMERSELLRSVESQRLATLAWATAERGEGLRTCAAS